MRTFDVQIVTPEEVVYSGEAVHLSARNSEGSFGMKAHHAPMMTILVEGEVSFTKGDGESTETFRIPGGSLEFSENRCTILADGIILDKEEES